MPTYRITDPETGRVIRVTGDSPPTEAELKQIFAAAQERPDASAPAPDEPTGLGEFWQRVNPMEAVRGISHAVRHPIQTAQAIGQAQGQLGVDAAAAFQRGDYGTAVRKGVNYLLPVLGPELDYQADLLAQGKTGRAVGAMLGTGTALAAPQALRLRPNAAVAASLERGATSRIADVMAPPGQSATKIRMGNTAARIAPQLAREEGLGAWTRGGYATKVAAKLDEAEAMLDAAADARNPRLVEWKAPIIRELQKKRDRLTAQTVRVGAMRAGQSVVPSPNAGRAAVIDRAITEINKLGPVNSYEAIRVIREAYDKTAKVKYNPSMTADFLAKQGEAAGAADVTDVLRRNLAGRDPATAAANARYSLFRAADDVLRAAEETDRVRPRVGRKMLAAATGGAVGGAASGGMGAAIGMMLAPMVDTLVALKPTTQIATARLMARMADALRAGRAGEFRALYGDLLRATGQSVRANVGLAAPARAAAPAMAQDEPDQ